MYFDAYGLHVGEIAYIRFYALILLSGMLAAAWLTARRAKPAGLEAKYVWDGLVWAIIPGLIGARLYHVLTPSPSSMYQTIDYLRNPLLILDIRNGGLGIYGAIVGGILGILYYGRRHKQPILRWFDVIVPGLALAQAIGRWGNWVNQELYGAPTNLPWAIYIAPENRVAGFKDFSYFHPLFLYESIWNLGTCLFLIWLDKRMRRSDGKSRFRPGDLLLVYLILYPLIRFLLDFVRLDSNMLGMLTTAQLVSLLTMAFAGGLLFVRHRFMPVKTPMRAKSQSD